MPRVSAKTAIFEKLEYLVSLNISLECISENDDDDLLCNVTGLRLPSLPSPDALLRLEEVTAHDDDSSFLSHSNLDELFLFLLQLKPHIRNIEPRLPLPRSTDFRSRLFNELSGDHFRSYFRMGRHAFAALLEEIEDDPVFQNKSQNSQAPVWLQLAVSLYRFGSFGSGASTVETATLFAVGDGTTRLYHDRVIVAILRILPKYLIWPAGNDYQQMRTKIEQKTRFPGCVGILDGSDMVLQNEPLNDGDAYLGRKKTYGLNLQAICDSEGRFTYASTGYPLSVADSTVFADTTIFKNPNRFFSLPDEYLLGDKVYRVTRRIVLPYKAPVVNEEAGGYKRFNMLHARARTAIDHTFGVLKNRWMSLSGIPILIRGVKDHARVVAWIMSCVCLHNFLLSYEVGEEWVPVENNYDENAGIDEDDELRNTEERREDYELRAAERREGYELRDKLRVHFNSLNN